MRKPVELLMAIGFMIVVVAVIHAQVAEETMLLETYDLSWENLSYSAENVRDPFESYIKEIQVINNSVVDENVVLPELTVQAVVWGGPFPQAIVNDIILRINDTVGDTEAKVIGISKSRVDFEYKRVLFNSTVKAGNFTNRDNKKDNANNPFNYPNSGSGNNYLTPPKK